MSYEDLHEHGSESTVKAAGKLRQQGKPYESTFFPSHSRPALVILNIASSEQPTLADLYPRFMTAIGNATVVAAVRQTLLHIKP